MDQQKLSAEERLLKRLEIVDADIVKIASDQPLRFIASARHRVQMMRRRAEAVATLEATKASIAVKIRNRKNEKGEKITEGALKEKLESHPDVKKCRADSDRAHEDEEFAKLIVEAYRMRRDAIRIVADMQSYEGMREGAEVERMEQGKKMRATARKLLASKRYASVSE